MTVSKLKNLILRCKRSKQICDDDCPKSMSLEQFSPIKSAERDADVPTNKEKVVMPEKENMETPKATRITSEESSFSSSDDRRSRKRKKKSKAKQWKKRGSRRHHSSSDDSSKDEFGKSSRQNFSYFPPSLQFMNNLFGGLPVPNYFLSRVHIPHNYNAHPVHSFQWICKTLRQISNQFDNCVIRAHHHLLIWRNLSRGKTWKHWQMLPSQTLMKIEKVVLVLAKRWECFVYIENRKSWPYCYFNLLRPVFNLFVKLKRARIVYEKWSARIHYSKQEEKKRR